MHLLVATDGSPEADAALAHATDIADATDGSITVVYAVDPVVSDSGGDDLVWTRADAEHSLTIEGIDDAERRGQAILDDAVAFARDLGAAVDAVLLYGDPVRAITDYAEEADVDGIFVGHRGRSERTDLMLGSVAKSVVERATIPVTVVR